MYALDVAILGLALVLQSIAALFAFTQLRRSGRHWPSWACLAAALVLMVLRRAVPLASDVARRTVDFERVEDSALGLLVSLLMAAGVVGLRHVFRELETQRIALTAMAREDELTKLWNRRHTLELAAQELGASRRFGRQMTVMMIDLDHFKRVNDTLGHEAGDRALAEIAQRLRRNVRTVDQLGRIGGEEFLVVLPETSLADAQGVAERLRASAHEPWPPPLPEITVSIGVAELLDGDGDVSALIGRADAALYRAKNAGRDRVAV